VKGIFPSRKAQFCTEYLKLAPQKRWIDENLTANGIDFVRYSGVRRDESATGGSDAPERSWDTYFDCELVQPDR
jgi:3'-phosphoadenosine 5'-phosphosulfate sulfotransferase (PAPS reductase)/FAD synthetase